jgi:hypothetical protein
MPSEHCSGEAVPGRLPILPPPVALYISDGLGFEPYDGVGLRVHFPFTGR